MTELTQQAIEVVDELNDETLMRNEYFLPFVFTYSSQYISYISFMGIVIWDEDNDEREYIGDTDEKEPLKTFIIRKSLNVLKDLNLLMGAFY